MPLASVFNIAGSDMNAQSVRLNTVTSNIANAKAASSSVDKIYRARHPMLFTMFRQTQGDSGSLFADQDNSDAGVQVLDIVEDQSLPVPRYEPNHPTADASGYVYYPNMNVVEEMADIISASRVFQVNAEMVNTAKQMMQKVLALGR